MKIKIIFKDLENNIYPNVCYVDNSENSYLNIWDNIKLSIKYLNKINSFSLDNLIKTLCKIDNYYIDDNTSYLNYIALICYDNNELTIKIRKAGQTYHLFVNKYLINYNKEGNCVDDFIIRGITPKIELINKCISDIESGTNDRMMSTEYHNTGQYEKDFFNISMIKKYAQTIVDNCNKQLESLSDNYTK